MITNSNLVERAEIEWLRGNLSKLDFKAALAHYESLYNHARKLAPGWILTKPSNGAELLKSDKIITVQRRSKIFQSAEGRGPAVS